MKLTIIACMMQVPTATCAGGMSSLMLMPYVVQEVRSDGDLILGPGKYIDQVTGRVRQSPYTAVERFRLWGVDPDVPYLRAMLIGTTINCQTYPTKTDEEPTDNKVLQCFRAPGDPATGWTAPELDVARDLIVSGHGAEICQETKNAYGTCAEN